MIEVPLIKGTHLSRNSRLQGEHRVQIQSTRLQSARRMSPACSTDGYFHLHPANGRKQKSRQKALIPRPSDGWGVQKKKAVISLLFHTYIYGQSSMFTPWYYGNGFRLLGYLGLSRLFPR